MVMVVPPRVEPDVGLTLEMVGAGTEYLKPSAFVAVPPGVVTTTSLAPMMPAGVSAVIEVALTTTTLVAAAPPTVTLLAPVKFVPVIVNGVPPVNTPLFGLMLEIVGKAIYVKLLFATQAPPGVFT